MKRVTSASASWCSGKALGLQLLWGCSFGDVFEGTWMGAPVAIKTLKRDVDELAKADFFQEADIMK